MIENVPIMFKSVKVYLALNFVCCLKGLKFKPEKNKTTTKMMKKGKKKQKTQLKSKIRHSNNFNILSFVIFYISDLSVTFFTYFILLQKLPKLATLNSNAIYPKLIFSGHFNFCLFSGGPKFIQLLMYG